MAGSRERDPQNTRITGWKILAQQRHGKKILSKEGETCFGT
jgi:hypothetical protein